MPINNVFGSTWENFHENLNVPVSKIGVVSNTGRSKWEKYNQTAVDIENEISQAITSNRSLKACGSRWSMSPIPVNNDILLDTSNMAVKFDIDKSDIHPGYLGHQDNLIFSQCGVTIKKLNEEFKKKNKSMSASGASNGQTIGGAISTGVHVSN